MPSLSLGLKDMVLIRASRDITASLDSVWDVIADFDKDPELWHGSKSIKNISKTGNIVEREVVLAFIYAKNELYKFLRGESRA
jgi:hypothetical protein